MNRGDELRRELGYLRFCTERDTAKILQLDSQSIALRHELEQKRRGFRLLADLAVTLAHDADYDTVFVSMARRVNAALNMQRTAVLVPDAVSGLYRPFVLQGYPAEREEAVAARQIAMPRAFFDGANPILVTGADPDERYRDIREALDLPYFISSPVLLHNDVIAIFITGRAVEQMPFLPRLGRSDVETVQTVALHLAALMAERRMIEAEERTRIMLDATPLCCNFWDEDHNNTDCNEEAVRLFGLSSKQEYLERFGELSPEFQPDGRPSAEKAEEEIDLAFETGYARFEWMHRKLDGERIPTEITLVRVKRGERYIVAGYTRDLREQKAMLAEMQQTQDELRASRDVAEKNARAKSEFLANMSHEIRTPMNAVLGMIHLMSETEMNGRQRGYVEKAEHSAKMLMRIINDILDFSKIDAGRLEVEQVNFSIRDALNTVRDTLAEQVREKGLALNVGASSDTPDIVVGDPLRLEQIVLNLAGNAVKFTPKGSVDIRASTKWVRNGRAQLLFEVRDTGIGLTEDQIALLFQPFSQADASMTRKYGGTGLGLAISRSLVELMDGEIWCESRPGEGSTFSFTAVFRLPKDAAATPDAALPEDDFASLAGMRVLLAEDNDINQMIAVEMLSSRGVVVDVAANGIEALEALRNNPYDLVLMDIQMPEMDGLTAAVKIRSDPKFDALPIVAMTAHAMTGDREASLRAGMNDHITKPIDPRVLYETLARWDKRER